MLHSPSILLTRGIVGIVAGLLAFLWPGLTMTLLVLLFGGYAFIDGVTNVVLGFTHEAGHRRASWSLLLQGLVGVAAGVLAFVFPPAAALALVFWIAAWAMVTGAFEIVAAIRMRREISGEWLLALSGIMSVVVGVLFFASPAMGIVTIAWILGAYAAASGILLVALAIRLKMLSGGAIRV